MNVKLLAPAQNELDEAVTWFAAQAPGLGDAFLIETLKTITLITRHPQAWHRSVLRPGVAGWAVSLTASSTAWTATICW